MYTEENLVCVAKRENNNKRAYLVVNPLQGKHIPVNPKEAFCMFDELGKKVKDVYKEETLLVVGFAETATAIGAYLGIDLDSYYIQTTREEIEGVEYLYFTESHSHATEQRLVKGDIHQVIKKVDRILFVEDEVTTGNTILKIVRILKEQYKDQVKFSVASLLNGMNKESLARYHDEKIEVHYLVKTDHTYYGEVANKVANNGAYLESNVSTISYHIKEIEGCIDARRVVTGKAYKKGCQKLWEEIKPLVPLDAKKRILVIGTEEFMYPPLYVGEKLEEIGHDVRCHATTRSPIVVSQDKDYPLYKRFTLQSVYEKGRKTFIYNLENFDQVYIISDTKKILKEEINTLVNAVTSSGNQEIYFIRWC